MSYQPIVQFLRCEVGVISRVYFFQVRETSRAEVRAFSFSIPNEAFLSHRARYQDAAAICAQRLRRELDSSDNHPAETEYVISDAELDHFRSAHTPKHLKYPRRDGEEYA